MIKAICSLIFKLSGWKLKGTLPEDLRSFILLGAPHTSNHDFIPAMAVARYMKRDSRFLIKDSWLRFPLNLILKPAGAIGVDRKKLKTLGKASSTDILAQLFKDNPELVLMISPEGTRSPNPNWKTGFYYIAQKAQVPIVLAYADFEKKEAGFGPVIYPRDFNEDMSQIMNFYMKVKGKRPDNFKIDSRFAG